MAEIHNIFRPKSKDEVVNSLSSLSQEEKNEKLIEASFRGNKDLVVLLLKAGANVNAKNKWGYSASMRASFRGNKDIIEILIKAKFN
jgi:ankyrin repeat protein